MRNINLQNDLFIRICNSLGITLPVKEYRFYQERRWRIDYAWPSLFIACEIEGGLWIKGGHIHPIGFLKNMEKYNKMAELGWTLLRYQFSEDCSRIDWEQLKRVYQSKLKNEVKNV